MATSNEVMRTTIAVTEDLSAAGAQFHGVAFADGKLANNADECSGILQNSPASGDHAALVYAGESKYAAGGAISAGGKITVSTSGWFTSAGSNDTVVGEAKNTVTSGSLGTGIFEFANVGNAASGVIFGVTTAESVLAGKAYALVDNKLANNAGEAAGILVAAIGTSGTGDIVVSGKVQATYADSYGANHPLMATTSGYMTTQLSGQGMNAYTLTAADSGTDGTVMFTGLHMDAFGA